ncbi:transcriptional adapter 2B-like isoform X1 [Ctenocephalides felis]|uniref:transcriptional adapter 2B-like isoform X1 n=2 Tax=Ctenocephalides felis TaxID=7515 RepID=UPI000E6E1117|nr:transcriptional adapter 2B-like isoform X1 [Ctenocephalides felis]
MADLNQKISCTYCEDEISGVRVHCAICQDIELCLQCFAAGAEIGPHKNDHDYQLMEPTLNVFRGKGAWSNMEIMWLLDAVEHYGFGNWEDIAKHVETRTPEAAKDEYINKFVTGVIGRLTWGKAVSTSEIITKHTPDSGDGDEITPKLEPLDITTEEAIQLEYLPKRDDFQSVYDAEADELISIASSIITEHSNFDRALKLSIADMNARRRRERERRERMVRDYQLVAKYFRPEQKRQKISKEHKELSEQFRSFCQFYTANEYEQFIDGLAKEQQLRFRLFELVRYRRNGLTTMDECKHYEQHVAELLEKTGHIDAAGSSGNSSGEKPTLLPRKSENLKERSFTDQKFMLSGYTSNSPDNDS